MTRYKHKDSRGVFSHPEQHPRGDYVLYTDHAAEMREVLGSLPMIRKALGESMVQSLDQRNRNYLALVTIDAIIDKYRHYLDKGE
jgi:hypothetical protein